MLLAGLVMVGLLVTACAPAYRPPRPPVMDPNPGRPGLLTADAILKASARMPYALEDAEMSLRIAEVRADATRSIAAFDPRSANVLVAAAEVAHEDGRHVDGLALFEAALEAGTLGPTHYALEAATLVDAGQFRSARDVAFDGLDRFPANEEIAAVADRAIDEDPLLIPPVKTLEPDRDLDVLKALGGGSTVTLKAKLDGENVAAIKPDQDLGQSMYRSEIAYYRLCQILRCRFRVPYNAHVRISRADFNELYSRVDSPKQLGYAGKFGHLRWKNEEGVDYLHATWKGWVPGFTGFPIEATGAWTRWLAAGSQRDDSMPVVDWLPTLANQAGPRGWNRHKRRVRYAGDMTMGELIRQISDQLAMDFLANNWDRFAGTPELFGANCHIESGGLVAIDNGASFPPWHTKRVERRLKLVQRFNRSFVNAVRRLDHDTTLQRLFPEATGDERARFAIFWERRQQFLDYVDGLIEEHGANAVYMD